MAPKRIVEILAEAYSAPFKCRGERSGLNKEKPRAGVAEICGQNGSAVVKSGRRTKIRASFAVAPQTAKVTATVRGTCSVKVEKASDLWAEDTEGSASHRDASSLCRDCSKGPTPETSDTGPRTAREGRSDPGAARPCSVSRRHGNEKGEDSAGRRGAREAALTELSAWSLCVAGGNLCPTCRRRRGELCIGKGVTCSGHCCPRSADRGRRLSLQDGPESSSQERVQRQTGTSAPRPGCRGPVTA